VNDHLQPHAAALGRDRDPLYARCGSDGVTGAELLQLLMPLRACLTGERDTPTRAVRITWNRTGLTLASGRGPVALVSTSEASHERRPVAVAVDAWRLIREVRRVPRDTRLQIDCARTTAVIFAHRRKLAELPSTSRGALHPLAGDDATGHCPLAVIDSSDWIELADRLQLKGRRRRARAQDAPPPVLELTPTSMRLAGKGLELAVQHDAASWPAGPAAYARSMLVSMRMVADVARAYVGCGGFVAVTALTGREFAVRYAFGRLALTVQVTGCTADDGHDPVDAAADGDGDGDDDELEV
jgi:hypothetical protein